MQGIGAYPGTRDFLFKDYARLEYIFNTWRRVCKKFGYDEYIIPLLEFAELYKAKSGDELGSKQLYEFIDKGGREVAIRPEATPSITRAISRFYKQAPKPFRVFSILNFMRYERPQSGRMREFWQLNVDIFGEDNVLSDIQIISIALETILAFGPSQNSFRFYINSRNLMEQVFKALGLDFSHYKPVLQFIDRFGKLDSNEFKNQLVSLRQNLSLSKNTTDFLEKLYSISFEKLSFKEVVSQVPVFAKVDAISELQQVFVHLSKDSAYAPFVYFNPTIVRGLDYYDGIVFEAFDTSPSNRRALLGGGRYNTLGHLFGIDSMSAVGFGKGNYTLEAFLDNWNLWPKDLEKSGVTIFVPILKGMKYSDYTVLVRSNEFTKALEKQGVAIDSLHVVLGTKEMGVTQALRFAAKRGYDFILFYGTEEATHGTINIKKL